MSHSDFSQSDHQSIYRQRSGELAFRDDLTDSIGMIVGLPPHLVKDDGSIIWGDWALAGPYESEQVYIELESFVLETIADESKKRPNLPPLERLQPTHLYDYPPAAQGMPEIAAMLWEHGKPIMENGLMLYEAGRFVRSAYARVRGWYENKNEEISELNKPHAEQGEPQPHGYVQNKVTLTQGAIIALIVAELVDRVGYQSNLEIDCHARGFAGYNSPGHPNPQITYLVRVAFSKGQFGYVVNSNGKLLEYFRIDDSELVSLPLPNILSEDSNEIDLYRDQPSEDKWRLRTS